MTRITNRELADAIGVSPSMASRIRNGKRCPSVRVLDKLAKYLSADLARLVNAHGQGPGPFGAEVRRLLEKK
jgi:transcriptional regulator with XRE-family HTH domain